MMAARSNPASGIPPGSRTFLAVAPSLASWLRTASGVMSA